MRKITWDFLSMELTRRCQLSCKHCFRGKSQNIDLSNEDIDSLLKQTEIIGFMHLTGGEPILNLDGMQHILDKLFEYRIPLFKLQIISNGFEKSERFVDIIKQYSDMIKLCYLEADIDMEYYVTIGISVDRYHVGYDSKEALKYYKKELSGYAKVIPMTSGNIPVKSGNAVNLPEALDNVEKPKLDTRIEILSKDIKPMCPSYRTYKIVHEEQVYIVCEMSISALGNVTMTKIASNDEYVFEDKKNNYICHVSENIYDSILKFNQGKISCVDRMLQNKKKEEKKKSDPSYLFKQLIQSIRVQQNNPDFYDNMVDFFANKHITDPGDIAEDIVDGNVKENEFLTSSDVSELKKEILEYYGGQNE